MFQYSRELSRQPSGSTSTQWQPPHCYRAGVPTTPQSCWARATRTQQASTYPHPAGQHVPGGRGGAGEGGAGEGGVGGGGDRPAL